MGGSAVTAVTPHRCGCGVAVVDEVSWIAGEFTTGTGCRTIRPARQRGHRCARTSRARRCSSHTSSTGADMRSCSAGRTRRRIGASAASNECVEAAVEALVVILRDGRAFGPRVANAQRRAAVRRGCRAVAVGGAVARGRCRTGLSPPRAQQHAVGRRSAAGRTRRPRPPSSAADRDGAKSCEADAATHARLEAQQAET